MQIRLSGETPFQVLSTTFTIGPSTSGYDLMFSADGVNYSKLFTVGANVNRQVTQVAAGSYYYLSGNTGNVVVNWFGNCVVDNGGGGGGYVLPVASQDTLGGVKIGSGLTMSGDTLNANPGGYTLPIASENVLGGVKIGSGITIDANGVISAQGGGAPSDYNAVKEQVSANTENIETLSGVTSGLTEVVAGKQDTLSAGNGIDLSGNTVSIKIGDGLAFSGDTLVVSGGTGGGIEKVSSLPATAEEGDVVWLEGASRTGYTIVFAENVGDAEWPWGLDQEVFTLDGDPATARYNGWIGRWRKFSQFNGNRGEYSDIMVRPRMASNNAVLDIVIINGSHTIGLGQNGISMTSDVEFPGRGCLYVYTGGKWYSKPTFEWEYNQSEAVALIGEIRGGIEDFDVDNFVMRYDVNGISREFKINSISNYGVDFQASDDRGTVNGEWGKLSILNYRINNDGSIADLVGEHWIVNENQVRDIIGQSVGFSFLRFGNDSRGYLTYDADNDRFEYDSGYIATGDTTTAYADLVDWLLTKQGVIDGALIFNYLCVQNVSKFFVTSSGETKTYTYPTLGWRALPSPYTIGDYTFGYEVTYRYSDWEMKIDMSENNNVGANLRITAL